MKNDTPKLCRAVLISDGKFFEVQDVCYVVGSAAEDVTYFGSIGAVDADGECWN